MGGGVKSVIEHILLLCIGEWRVGGLRKVRRIAADDFGAVQIHSQPEYHGSLGPYLGDWVQRCRRTIARCHGQRIDCAQGESELNAAAPSHPESRIADNPCLRLGHL
jgi:hypothetical protein